MDSHQCDGDRQQRLALRSVILQNCHVFALGRSHTIRTMASPTIQTRKAQFHEYPPAVGHAQRMARKSGLWLVLDFRATSFHLLSQTLVRSRRTNSELRDLRPSIPNYIAIYVCRTSYKASRNRFDLSEFSYSASHLLELTYQNSVSFAWSSRVRNLYLIKEPIADWTNEVRYLEYSVALSGMHQEVLSVDLS